MRRAWPHRLLLILSVPVAFLGLAAPPADWALIPFARPDAGNPVMQPRRESLFTDPVSKMAVHWEALHTFNPAAIVRNGKVYLLYRAEDDSGSMMIGGHTSRIGLAESNSPTARASTC